VNYVKFVSVFRYEFQRIGLMEFKRVMLLRHVVHANHLESRVMVANAATASTAKQVE
jgi:hypothetical protein